MEKSQLNLEKYRVAQGYLRTNIVNKNELIN